MDHLDTAINVKVLLIVYLSKNSINCVQIFTLNGFSVPLESEAGYLGAYFFDTNACWNMLERPFYRAA